MQEKTGTGTEAELTQLLQQQNHDHLVALLLELLKHHPALQSEVAHLLSPAQDNTQKQELLVHDDNESSAIDDEVTEDWDFSGDEVLHDIPAPASPQELDIEDYRQRLTDIDARLTSEQAIAEFQKELRDLADEAETRKEQHDIQAALALYGLLIDTRLTTTANALQSIFDKQLDKTLSALEMLLTEACSSMVLTPTLALTPFLSTEERQHWLKRLFAFWLARIDNAHIAERIQLILHAVAWSEDSMLLHTLAQQELQQQPSPKYTNIVDLQQLHRVRSLERFLRMWPMQ